MEAESKSPGWGWGSQKNEVGEKEPEKEQAANSRREGSGESSFQGHGKNMSERGYTRLPNTAEHPERGRPTLSP